MKPISPQRFDALAGYARQPAVRFMADEVGWYEHGKEAVSDVLRPLAVRRWS